MKKMLFAALCCMLLTLGLTSCQKNTPEAVAVAAMNDIKNGDYKAFAEKIITKEGATQEEKEQFVNMVSAKCQMMLEKKQGIKDVEATGCEIAEDGETATVTLKVTYGDGSEETNKSKMQLVDGEWKLKVGK